MKKSMCADVVIDLLKNPVFCEIYQRINMQVPTFDEFAKWPLPEDYTSEELWVIITLLRRQEANVFPMESYIHPQKRTEVWCSLNKSISQSLGKIVVLGRYDLYEDTVSENKIDHYLQLPFLARDISAALFRDGQAVSERAVLALMLGEKNAENLSEQLALNAINLLFDLNRYVKHRLTPWIFESLQLLLDEGCSELSYDAPYQMDRGWKQRSRKTDDAIVEDISTILSNAEAHFSNETILDVVNMTGVFWDLQPLKRWNGLAELIIRHIFFLKTGMPALRFVPLSRILFDLNERLINGAEARHAFIDDVVFSVDIGQDETRYMGIVLDLMVDSLEEYKRAIAESVSLQNTLSVAINSNVDLNYRQRHILQHAALEPLREFRISTHRKLYGIAYATARSDLLGLEKAGLMEMYYSGKAMAFRKTAHMEDMILNNAARS